MISEGGRMGNPLKICDLMLRDGHQSLLATRMRTDDMLPIAAEIDKVGYWAVEMWGGATFDSAMRFLGENPWDRIRRLKEHMPNTPFLMLLRGQNVVGYKHYPDDVLESFVVHAHKAGIDVFRIFDALNDVRNMRRAMEVVKEEGGHVQASICYTIGPPYSIDYFVNMALKLSEMGADSICIKDMAGLITPYIAYDLTARLKEDVGLPVHLHSHSTSGMASAALLKAAEAGVDIVDSCISALSGTTSHPPTESLVATLSGTERDTDFELDRLAHIAGYFTEIRKRYARFESGMRGADVRVLQYQIPGGMLSNLVSQLRGQNAEDRYEDVLAEVPQVREELGYPPLVTPSSQIVGTQATLNVVLGERYKIIPEEVRQYVRGYYGRPPAPIDLEIQRLAIGDEEPIDCRPADLIPPGMEEARAEIGDLARNEEDVISYALFPQVARPFLERRARGGDGKEPVVAGIVGLLLKQLDEQAGAEIPAGSVISPWKVAWRPGAGRWTSLIDGAGGMR
jgi:pyruvate/oxaloacetate carboxyltransferase